MRQVAGDLWEFGSIDTPDIAIAITTNGDTNKQTGRAVMGRGCARQAAKMWPDLPDYFGNLLNRYRGTSDENRPMILRRGMPWTLLSFPVKHHWMQPADLALIERSARLLVQMADARGWTAVYTVRAGCGNGRLQWSEVEPILERYFDDRFVIVESGTSATQE